MRGFQAEGASPLVTGEPFPDPETKATAIRIGNPASWKLAEAAAEESGGRFAAVSDAQILSAQRELAARDGVFVEPASAAGVAGLLAELARGPEHADYAGATVAITVTGHGLKDTATALEGHDSVVDTWVDRQASVAHDPFRGIGDSDDEEEAIDEPVEESPPGDRGEADEAWREVLRQRTLAGLQAELATVLAPEQLARAEAWLGTRLNLARP